MKSYVIKGFFGVMLALGLLGGSVAQAANLTQNQVQAILQMLQSFGADPATVSNVSAALGGSYYQGGYYNNGQYNTPYVGCPTISYNLYYGLYDSQTGGQVSQLQRFLGVPPTGYYGSLTRQAVADFQTRYNLYPVTGGVGPLTRQQIASVCGNGSGYPYQNGYVQITGVTGPNTLAVNQQGTWTVTTNSPSNSYVNVSVQWGDQNTYPYAYSNQTSYVNGQNTFTHAYSYPGTYTAIFTATDNNGHSNSASATVVVGGSGYCGYGYSNCAAPTISSISQSQGPVGTQITITGSGFTSSNVVHFGVGGSMSVPSYNNGTIIYYTIPSSVSACDIIQTFAVCTMMVQQVTAGSYPIYVSNANGQSGTVYFTVNGGSQSSGLQVTSPTQGSVYYRGQDMTINWNWNIPSGYTGSTVTLDLYTAGGANIGTIAIPQATTGTYTWHIPGFPQNYMCTLQYPNGLCGTNIPTGQYYIKATLGSYGSYTGGTSATSGIFTIYQQ
jgi:hypothetical protein